MHYHPRCIFALLQTFYIQCKRNRYYPFRITKELFNDTAFNDPCHLETHQKAYHCVFPESEVCGWLLYLSDSGDILCSIWSVCSSILHPAKRVRFPASARLCRDRQNLFEWFIDWCTYHAIEQSLYELNESVQIWLPLLMYFFNTSLTVSWVRFWTRINRTYSLDWYSNDPEPCLWVVIVYRTIVHGAPFFKLIFIIVILFLRTFSSLISVQKPTHIVFMSARDKRLLCLDGCVWYSSKFRLLVQSHT